MYDVIVVGAGPAGCTASKVLAEKGYKVLLVEKFKKKERLQKTTAADGSPPYAAVCLLKRFFIYPLVKMSKHVIITRE